MPIAIPTNEAKAEIQKYRKAETNPVSTQGKKKHPE